MVSKRRGRGRGRGHLTPPLKFNQTQCLLPQGLGKDDDDPLLEEGEVDMRAMTVAGGVMEFELLRLPPQSKTVGPWTFQQGGWGRRRSRARLCASLHHTFSHMYTMCESCMQDVMCLH